MEGWQELIYNRYKENWPENHIMSIGKYELTKTEALEHIKKKDEVYEFFLEVEKHYLSSLKDGFVAQ